MQPPSICDDKADGQISDDSSNEDDCVHQRYWHHNRERRSLWPKRKTDKIHYRLIVWWIWIVQHFCHFGLLLFDSINFIRKWKIVMLVRIFTENFWGWSSMIFSWLIHGKIKCMKLFLISAVKINYLCMFKRSYLLIFAVISYQNGIKMASKC